MAAPGDTVGRYELLALLGRGGMGEVWEAVLVGPAGFRKPVALKLLREGPSAEDEDRQALIHEARLGALLSHPNVVATHELGQASGQWYVAMELVRGSTVEALARAGPLRPHGVLDIAIQACAGLAHIHSLRVDGRRAGLVHRDLKPANLLVDRSGLVKIADLGIARLSTSGEGRIAGTPMYMSPEQAEGASDARSDLFALGVVVFALLTRRRPFGGKGRPDPTELRARIRGRLADPTFFEGLDGVEGLADVVRRCLRADPDERWPDAVALGEALRRVRQGLGPGPTLAEVLRGAGTEVPDGEWVDTHGSSESSASGAPTVVMQLGNLPHRADRYHGRDELRARLNELLAAERLVTLVGPGGMGKTRLALEVAHDRAPGLVGGAWFCDLSRARALEGVVHAVGRALDVPLDRSDPVGHMGRALAGRGRCLVVLDNFEQVQALAPETVGRWLEQAPGATFLVTTQVALGVRGERTLSVGPLDATAGAALFRDRAARPPGPDDDALLLELVRRLDGMPLALELAAARTRVLSMERLVGGLEDRFRLLAGGAGDRPERHRSLRASLDASWELLSEAHRSALAQLSVFRGPASLEAVEAVVDLTSLSGEPWTVDVLDALVGHSFVTVAGERFGLLSTVRAYAAERLDAAARGAAEERHARYFVRYAPELVTGSRRPAFDVEELEDLVAATRWALARRDGPLATGLALAAWNQLAVRGPLRLGRELLEQARAVAPDDPWLARAWAHCLQVHGQSEPAAAALESALAHHRGSGDRRAAALVLGNLVSLYRALGRLDEAERAGLEALAIDREVGNRTSEAVVLSSLGNLMRSQGRFLEALPFYEASLEVARAAAPLHTGHVQLHLGALHEQLGNPDESERFLEASVRDSAARGDRRVQGQALLRLGVLHRSTGRLASARRLYQGAAVVLRELGDELGATSALENLASVHLDLGRVDEAARDQEQAMEVALRDFPPRDRGLAWAGLAAVRAAQGNAGEARTCLEHALALARSTRNRRSEALVLRDLARLDRQAGSLTDAERGIAAAAGLARTLGAPMVLCAVLGEQARIALARGASPDALVDEALALAQRARSPLAQADLLCTRAECLLGADPRGARAALEQARALVDELPATAPLRVRLDALDPRHAVTPIRPVG